MTRYRREACLRAAVAVGLRNAFDGRARHEKRLQHAVVHHVDAARLHALIVVEVVAGQRRSCHAPDRGIEGDRKIFGQHFLADHFLEGLCLVGQLLPMALDTMAEDLVEEHAAGAPRKNGRAGVGIGHRSRAQRFKITNHLVDGLEHGRVVGKVFLAESQPGFVARQLHSVVGLGGGDEEEPPCGLRGLNARAVRVHEPARLGARFEDSLGAVNVGVFGEGRGVLANLVFPGFEVDLHVALRLAELLRLLVRKVVGLVFGRYFDLGVGFDARQLLDGMLKSLVGVVPQHGADGVGVVVDGHHSGGETGKRARAAANLVGVVHGVIAYAHFNVELAVMVFAAARESSEGASDGVGVRVDDFVAQEVGRDRLRLQFLHGAVQLGLHGLQNRRSRLGGRAKARAQHEQQRQETIAAHRKIPPEVVAIICQTRERAFR